MKTKIQPQMATDQSGVAIILMVIFILVMGLIVFGITSIIAIGNQKSEDNILSAQANYAAETGVNDAVAALKAGANIPPNQNCQTFITEVHLNNILSSSPKVAYTCLLVNESVENLLLDVTTSQSSVVRINPVTPVTSLNISWDASLSGAMYKLANCTQANLQFVPSPSWTCPFAVMRIDLYQSNPTDQTAQQLNSHTASLFLFPTNNNGTPATTITYGGNPVVVPVNCNASTCSIKLNMPSFSDGYMRLTSIYADADDTTISSLASTLYFQNAQISIDSTGVDQGVSRRIQVRIPINNTTPAPNYVADAPLCKNYYYPVNDNGITGWNINDPIPDLYRVSPDQIRSQFPYSTPLCGEALKPAIYLYPPKAEKVNVKVSFPTGLAQTIPAYNNSSGWNVLAQPSGSLTDLSDNKTYPYLYWEGNTTNWNFDMSKGFVVAGKDTVSFLRHELPIIGLNQTETNAFIQYWAPKMEHNPYSLIHFAGSEYTNLAPLNITPKPNAVLRVFMAEEPIKQPVSVTPQAFPAFHRTGFTVVEWGGSVLSN